MATLMGVRPDEQHQNLDFEAVQAHGMHSKDSQRSAAVKQIGIVEESWRRRNANEQLHSHKARAEELRAVVENPDLVGGEFSPRVCADTAPQLSAPESKRATKHGLRLLADRLNQFNGLLHQNAEML
jgi:hypothetical protein